MARRAGAAGGEARGQLAASPGDRFTPRTMELFRAVGLGDRIAQVPPGYRLTRARVESLAGQWFEQSRWTPDADAAPPAEFSPCSGAAIAQDALEPILRDRAAELGADIRMATTLARFEQDEQAVTAILRDADGSEFSVRADYMIAADGHRSPVRRALEIECHGRGHIRTMRSVLFRAALDDYLESGVRQFEIDQPDLKAFLTTYGDGRWVLMFMDDRERDAEALLEAIRKAVGRPDLPVEIVVTGRWELSGWVADSFRAGRIFLAGDAAHTLPPARGGYGANTGIADAHNLAWKLAAVVARRSDPSLLDSYDAERRPVAWLRHQQIFARPDYRAHAAGIADDEPIRDDDAMEFGELYRSAVILGAAPDLPPALRPDQWAGQPGTRAPHQWVTQKGRRISTLDMLQRGWILLAEDERWSAAAQHVSETLGTLVTPLRAGRDFQTDQPEAFRAAFGISAAGASLIRPDGYIAWRACDMPDHPVTALQAAMARAARAA